MGTCFTAYLLDLKRGGSGRIWLSLRKMSFIDLLSLRVALPWGLTSLRTKQSLWNHFIISAVLLFKNTVPGFHLQLYQILLDQLLQCWLSMQQKILKGLSMQVLCFCHSSVKRFGFHFYVRNQMFPPVKPAVWIQCFRLTSSLDGC